MKTHDNFDLTTFNAYKIKSKCKKAYFPENETELIKCLQSNHNRPKFILGNGNNVILSKKNYMEEFIILNGCFEQIIVEGEMVVAEAGATMQKLSETAMEYGLKGSEIFYDIPSSVGGAIVMNAGAGGYEIKDILIKVRYFDLFDKEIKELSSNELELEYRNSFFQKNTNTIVLKAWFKLERGEKNSIREKMQSNKEIRWEKQPRDFPNCGSVFKRPPGRFVGPMLDALKLKGFKIGGAQISEKHSGFIVNVGDATGDDVLKLIEYIKGKVKKEYNVDLEVEQRII